MNFPKMKTTARIAVQTNRGQEIQLENGKNNVKCMKQRLGREDRGGYYTKL
jgi:hypothetical protein